MSGDLDSRLRLVLVYLRRHAIAIDDAARSGDTLATKIKDTYEGVYARRDRASVALLEAAIEDHKRSRATPPFTRPEDDCEHAGIGPGQCPDCGMTFVYCHGCSEAGGAERAIYHAGPVCEINAGGAS